MKIVYARMPGYDFVSTPSDAVIRELEKAGHKIFWTDNLNYLPLDKYDVVFSPYESATLLGDAISKKLNIKHYAHIEWLPPWRIKKVNPSEYGLDESKSTPAAEEVKAVDLVANEADGKAGIPQALRARARHLREAQLFAHLGLHTTNASDLRHAQSPRSRPFYLIASVIAPVIDWLPWHSADPRKCTRRSSSIGSTS